MQQMIKRYFWTACLMLGMQAAWPFSLLGPVGNGGDSWQTQDMGFNPIVDGALPLRDPVQTGPKNIGEEYRRNMPVFYYTFDENFIGYFGKEGTNAVTKAFNVFNNLTNVDSYSSSLSEFPLRTSRVNYQASALGLYDLKSLTMASLMEQLGLADSVRYAWVLHSRWHTGAAPCPAGENYAVTERNFDIIASPLNQIQYSPYVNGALYTYVIVEDCDKTPVPVNTAAAVAYPVDPLKDNPPVASGLGLGFLSAGSFYTGLTRDDVAGLRYLLKAANVNTETAPGGSQLQTTTPGVPAPRQTSDFGLLLSQSLTNDPSALQALYPELVIASTATNYGGVVIATNVAAYYTNQSVSPVFTNYSGGSLTNNGYYFTNQPGPTVINYDTSFPPKTVPISTFDLATFSDLAKTNDPSTLQTLYPGLEVVNASYYFTWATNVNYVNYLTNYAWYGPVYAMTVPVSTNYSWVTNWNYTFGNIFTNHYYTNRPVTIQSIWTTNYAWYAPFFLYTNTVTVYTNQISGDFFIIPTNWCGFKVVGVLPQNNPPYLYGSTNTVNYNGITTNGIATGTNNLPGGNSYGLIKNYYDVYTNYNYMVLPGICEPLLQFATNYTTNVVTTYNYTFGNVVTNSYFTNSYVTILTTNIGPTNGGTVGTLFTNVTQVTMLTNVPSGDYYFVPPAWCSYSVLSTLFTNLAFATNTVTATIPAGVGNVGQQYSQTTISQYTNHTFLIQPSFCQSVSGVTGNYEGVENIKFIGVDRNQYDSLLDQFTIPITNTYQKSVYVPSNGVVIVQTFKRVVTHPDFLFSAVDMTSVGGVQNIISRNVQFNQANILNNLAGPGTMDSRTTIAFNKSGTVYYNQAPSFLNGPNYGSGFLYASFDGTTNAPVVYPNGTSIAALEAEAFIQFSPATLPVATNGLAYSATFNATGGQVPYTWSLATNSLALPNGLALAPSGVLSGTPTQTGTFNFVIQMADAASHMVQQAYSIIIH